MALPFAIPLIPILKIIALGSLKTVFLLLGALFFPRATLRLILGGASGMILPIAEWLSEADAQRSHTFHNLRQHLGELESNEFSSAQARQILFKLIKKTVIGMVNAVRKFPSSVVKMSKTIGSKLLTYGSTTRKH